MVKSQDFNTLHLFGTNVRVDVHGKRETLKGSVVSLARASQLEDQMTKEYEDFIDHSIQSTPMKFMYQLHKPYV